MKNFLLLLSLVFVFQQISFGQDFDCSITDCTCELTIEVTNSSGDFLIELAASPLLEQCVFITEEGTYTVIVDAENVDYLLAHSPQQGNLDGTVDVSITGCAVDMEVTIGGLNSIPVNINADCEDPFGQDFDCGISDCTCELTIEVTNSSGDFLVELAAFPFFEECVFITEEGTYTAIVDAENVDYLLAHTPQQGNLDGTVDVSITGCAVDMEVTIGGLNSIPVNINADCEDSCTNFPVPNPAEGLLCELGSFCIDCDGGVTVTGNALTSKIKIWNVTEEGCVDEVMGDWNGNRCYLCNHYSVPGSCEDTWTFPAGTVSATNNVFIEFQATESGVCGAGYTTPLGGEFGQYYNLSNQFAMMFEDGTCDGEGGNEGGVEGKSSENDNASLTPSIHVFPNPASDYLNINNSLEVDQVVQILNTNGQELMSTSIQRGSSTISLPELAAGIYYIHVFDEITREKTHVERIVILK